MGEPEQGPAKRIDWRALITAAVSAAVVAATTPYVAPSLIRPDPFRGHDAEVLRREVTRELEHAMQLLRAEMRVNLPPEATRQRIEALEEQLRLISPDWRPPTSRFSQLD